MLTATRQRRPPNEVDQVDFAKRQWTIPRTKSGDPLDVHLADRVVEILNALPRMAITFSLDRSGEADGREPNQKTMTALRSDVVVHGMRSTFQGLGDGAHFRYEAVEMALAHRVGNEVERRYMRDGLPMERMRL